MVEPTCYVDGCYGWSRPRDGVATYIIPTVTCTGKWGALAKALTYRTLVLFPHKLCVCLLITVVLGCQVELGFSSWSVAIPSLFHFFSSLPFIYYIPFLSDMFLCARTSLIHRDYISITKLWWYPRYDYKNELHCDTNNVASSKFGAHRDARYLRCMLLEIVHRKIHTFSRNLFVMNVCSHTHLDESTCIISAPHLIHNYMAITRTLVTVVLGCHMELNFNSSSSYPFSIPLLSLLSFFFVTFHFSLTCSCITFWQNFASI